jgi:formate dehydrogenase iron-sulfur subunit
VSLRIFIPADAAALSVGADAVARAIAAEAAGQDQVVEIVRTGSRGLLWLEPLVELATPEGRVAFANVRPAEAADLLAGHHPRPLGLVAALPWLARQTRQSFARVGVIDPRSLDDFRAHGGLAGLAVARSLAPAEVVARVAASGLRGRGGAGFPAGIKWRTVAAAPGGEKHIVCNADEGDSGTFADRMLIEGDPFTLIEGMAIAAHAVGATQGWIYLRSEYPHAARTLSAALSAARAAGLLGAGFDIRLRIGAGSYICGEETALLESLEGRRGVVRAKPPVPALSGLFGQPTVVNNVLTFAAVPAILADGAEAHAALGVGRSRGTLAVQLGGNIKRGGLFELPFGIPLREVVQDIGGGTRSGRPVRAVQVGGPLGAYLPASALDIKLDYEALAAAGGMLGHGGIVVFDDTVDMARQARFAFAFCAQESCGKCTPCRIGAQRGMETMDRIIAGEDREKNLAVIDDLTALMTDASLCAMGGLTPLPVQSALRHFPEDFRREPA